jgi:hypothetical protein
MNVFLVLVQHLFFGFNIIGHYFFLNSTVGIPFHICIYIYTSSHDRYPFIDYFSSVLAFVQTSRRCLVIGLGVHKFYPLH